MKHIAILFIFILNQSILSCQDTSSTFYANGKLFRRTIQVNDTVTIETFHKNGNIQTKDSFREITQDSIVPIGEQKSFFENGKIASYTNHSIRKGTSKLFFPNGNIQILAETKYGVPHGKFVRYYEKGTLEAKGEKNANLAVGIWKFYYPNGKLKGIKSYFCGAEDF